MVPEIVVPDLTGFKLKPYVSYKAPDVQTAPMTAEELFGRVYTEKIRQDFSQGKLGANNEPLEPSPEERMTAEEARVKVKSINSDII